MNHDRLATALRAWADSAPVSLFDGSRWIIACWQDPKGHLTASSLLTASNHLSGAGDEETAAVVPDAPIPARWLKSALDFDGRIFDLTVTRPSGPHLLAGVGLAAATPGPRENAIVHVWIAAASAAISAELHRRNTAIGRCQVGDPLWWDRRKLFEPLERFRAAATGWPPILPARFAEPGAWAGLS
ncbi:hypothetical protein AB0B28_06430 [Glycomyces sp. NPDC046736]|uniref:hypothetical protein n=1 Tax=Glycomyces sp. NPDC046736 TaxID=3155615 RepID=UPI0033DED1B2